MSKHPELYPPRDRATNVALIKRVQEASNQSDLEAAYAQIDAAMHPSLLSELDFMERTMPERQRQAGARFVDGFFRYHLPGILKMRRPELERSAEELRDDVSEHPQFYRWLLSECVEAAHVLGESLCERIRTRLAEIGDTEVLSERVRQDVIRRAGVARVEVRRWILEAVDAELANETLRALDRPSARMYAKAFIRTYCGGQLPRTRVSEIAGAEDLAALVSELRSLAQSAQAGGLLRISALGSALADRLEGVDLTAIKDSRGELAMGVGPCGRCSMMYAGTGLLLFDGSSPDAIEHGGEDKLITLPLSFNATTCPFCGELNRINAPMIFYSAARRQVVYNLPTLGQFTKSEALNVHRPVIESLRQRYLSQCSRQEAAAFESAHEDLTYNSTDFLYAVQMGTTAKEEHVFLLVRSAIGGAVLVDMTKGAMIALTPAECRAYESDERQWNAPIEVVLDGNGGEATAVSGAIERALLAFSERDFDKAVAILEARLVQAPEDKIARRNLATVLLTRGDREAARMVLNG